MTRGEDTIVFQNGIFSQEFYNSKTHPQNIYKRIFVLHLNKTRLIIIICHKKKIYIYIRTQMNGEVKVKHKIKILVFL